MAHQDKRNQSNRNQQGESGQKGGSTPGENKTNQPDINRPTGSVSDPTRRPGMADTDTGGLT